MKIITGLGNPGPQYAATRHNIGFMAIDALAVKFRVSVDKRSHRALVGNGRIGGEPVILVKPLTFMNLSGESVSPILTETRCTHNDLIVIHDDLDLPAGQLRIRKNGSGGGHNGISSIIQKVGTESFIRIKLGVGRPPGRMNAADYVLSDFGSDEELLIKQVIEDAVSAVMAIIHEGPDKAMNRFNKKVKQENVP